MRIPVGAPAHHHFMPVEHGHQLHPSYRRYLTIQDSHIRHPLSVYTMPEASESTKGWTTHSLLEYFNGNCVGSD
jgi:hypothetical protein